MKTETAETPEPVIMELKSAKRGVPKMYTKDGLLFVPANTLTVLFMMTDGTTIQFFEKKKNAKAYISIDDYLKIYPSQRATAIELCKKAGANPPLEVDNSVV